MPIITKSSPIAKDAPITFTLDKAALSALPVVVASAWYSDTANWKKVIINYRSTSDNEMLTVNFDATQVSPTGSLLVISPSKDVFEAISMTIVDFNNGSFRVPSTSLDQADFVVNFDSAAPLYTRDFANPNGQQSYEARFGSCSYVDGGISIYQSGAGDGYYFNRANVVTFVEGQTYKVRVYVKETSNSGAGAYSASIYIGPESGAGTVASYSAVQIDAAVGSYLEATFVANATNASGQSITWVGGAAGGYFVIGKIEVFGPPPAPSILAGAYAVGSSQMQNITSSITSGEGQSFVLANPATVTVVKVMISKYSNPSGLPLTGTLNMTLKASDYFGSGAEVVSTNTLDLSTLAESLPSLDGGVVCEFLFDTPVSLPSGTNSIKYNYAGLNINNLAQMYIQVWGYSPTIIDGIAYSAGGPISHVDFWFQILGN